MGKRSGNLGGSKTLIAFSTNSVTIVPMEKLSYQILVDLDVFKALTARLESEGQTQNDILRDLLGIDSPFEAEEPNARYFTVADALGRVSYPGQFYSRGLALPNETELRARYKGAEFRARIVDGNWVSDGHQYDSPSAAAGHITSTTVNGLRFWEGKRPGDRGWRRLDVIRDSQRK